jgi:HSP20 family protein
MLSIAPMCRGGGHDGSFAGGTPRTLDPRAVGETDCPRRNSIRRDDGKLIVRADVPGFKPDEIKVELEGNTLALSGEHEETSEEKQRDFLRRGRRFGAFRRSIVLRPDVDAEAVEAVTRDGVLEVTVPLPETEIEARRLSAPGRQSARADATRRR